MSATRNSQFQKSFNRWLNDAEISPFDHTLTLDTENPRLKHQRYVLEFIKKRLAYTVDGNGMHAGAVYEDLSVDHPLQIDDFEDKFRDHFARFYKWSYARNGSRNLMSYVALGSEVHETPTSYQVGIVVAYSPAYLPFFVYPDIIDVDASALELLQSDHRALKKQYQYLTASNGVIKNVNQIILKRIGVLKQINRDCISEMDTKNTNISRLDKTIRQMHKAGAEQDCPVCYVSLDSDTMIIPRCCHFICGECVLRCDGLCPMCRAEY
jgi:hypothetical protein